MNASDDKSPDAAQDQELTPEVPSPQNDTPVHTNPEATIVFPSQPSMVGSEIAPSSPTTIQSSVAPVPKSPSKRSRLAVLVIAIVAFLLAGSAAAYYAVVVPNQPENVLKTALSNTLNEKSASFTGSAYFTENDIASAVAFKGKSDIEKKVAQFEADITVTGVKIPVEFRVIQNDFYFKFGDLGSIKGLSALADPSLKNYIDQLIQKLNNQWIHVDRTLTDQVGVSCYADPQLTKEDKELLFKLYGDNPFAKIKQTSNETIRGKSATKYEIEIDNNKGAEYAKKLDQLSIVKKLKECSKSQAQPLDTKELADGGATPITLWVDKASKKIVKVASSSSRQDNKKRITQEFETVITYEAIEVTKPDGAKPIMQLFSEFAPLLQQSLPSQQSPVFDDVLGAFDILSN